MDFLLPYIDKLCQPHTDVYEDASKREMAFRRNKGTFFIQVSTFICLIFYMLITTGTPNDVQKGCFVILTLVTTFFLTFCRSHPNVINFIYFSIVTMLGPLIHYLYRDSIFFNSIGVMILPIWLLSVSGSKGIFLAQLVIQNIYLHVLYKPQMMLVLEDMFPENYFKRAANLTSFGVLINAIFVLACEISLEKAHFQIMEAETRKLQLERQKTFILSFSHELRNLINSMIGNIRLTMIETLPSSKENLLKNSEVCGEVLIHLVNNILDTGKIEVGELEINPIFNRAYEVWEKTWGICSQLIKQKRLFGQIRVQKNIPSILKIDAYRLMQVFLNLVGNALKFTESGSISIDIQWIKNKSCVTEECFCPRPFSNEDEDAGLFEKAQDFALFDDNFMVLGVNSKVMIDDNKGKILKTNNVGILKIVVTDTGCGVPPDKLPMLFHKFAQVHEDPSKRKLGTGLGLFITKELIHKMNGEIKVFSQVKKGSAFIACIPVQPGQECDLKRQMNT